MTDVRIVLTTVDQESKAKDMARYLVENHLAACVSIVPGVVSVYPWEGKIAQESEWLLIIKTHKSRMIDLKKSLRQHHPYTIPEFIVIYGDYVDHPYTRWLEAWLTRGQPAEEEL